METPSFMRSTLSLAFIFCVVAVIAMIFMKITPDEKLLTVITAIVSGYLGSRIPSADVKSPVENKSDEVG